MDLRAQGETTAGGRQAEAADLPAQLPDDVLVDVLRRLPHRGLAFSRCVCRAWRAVVDARRLLLRTAELLPRVPAGIFINYHCYESLTELFSRPSSPATGPPVSGRRRYLPEPEAGGKSWGHVRDHCNGLLLVDGGVTDDYHRPLQYVLNPATRWVAPLPLRRPPHVEVNSCEDRYLVYDPAASPHYQVVSVTRFLCKREPWDVFYDRPKYRLDPVVEGSEWPPSMYTLHVFSSRTGRWEDRTFVREGEAAGTVADMRHMPRKKRNAVYWRGALYVHCQTDFIMRLSLSDGKYQVIKSPMNLCGSTRIYLGKSEKGVYCASIHGQARILVWILKESCCEIQWVLRHDNDLFELLKHRTDGEVQGPWILQNVNCNYHEDKEDDNTKTPVEERFEWSSDNEDKGYDKDDSARTPIGEKSEWSLKATVDEKTAWSYDYEDMRVRGGYSGYVSILGFHPYKEIIFLNESVTTGMAYHLNSSRIEALGNLYPARYGEELPNERFVSSAFPYTPCWIKHVGDSKDNTEGHL